MAYPCTQNRLPHLLGVGLMLGLAAGGQIRGGNKYASLPGLIPADHQYPTGMHAFAPSSGGEAALGNPRQRPGRAFCADHPSVDHIEHGIVAQPGQRHWAIYDAKMLARPPRLSPNGIGISSPSI